MPFIFCFIIPLKQEKWSHMGFLRLPNLVPWWIFNVNILSIRAWIVTDQFCWIRLYFNLAGIWGKQKRRRQEGWGWVGAASIQGKQLIEGPLLFEEIWYTRAPLGNFGLIINTMCRLKHMFVFWTNNYVYH